MAEDKQVRTLRTKLDKVLEANKNEAAVELLEKLIELEPKNARWPHKRGDLLRKLNRDKEAVACYEAAVDIYADQGFIARAVAMAKTVLNLDPSRIDILQRVDPNAAQQIHREQRRSGRPASGVAAAPAAPAKRHPMIVAEGAAPPAPPSPPMAAKRHPMILDDAAPAPSPRQAPAAAPKRHPMVLDDMPATPPPSPAKRPQKVLNPLPEPLPELPELPPKAQPQPTAVKRHPMVLDDAPRAAPVPAAAAPRRTSRAAITLDKISLPPMRPSVQRAGAVPPAARVPDEAEAYAEVLANIDELSIDPTGPSNETRFSNAPPKRPITLDLSDDELAPRLAMSQVESQRPDPPSVEKLSKLPLFPLFAEVPKDALAEMIAGTDLIELDHGEYVMRKGDPGDALYGIVEGSVSVVVPGQMLNLTLAEGDVFGESCLLQDEKRHADVIAEGRLVALRIPREVLTRLFGKHPKLAEVLLELLTRRLLGNMLQASPLFQEFDANGRRDLSRLFEIRRAPANTMLAIVGKKMDGLYISLTGTLSVMHPGAPERIAPPGSMFGQNTLLSDEPSQVDIKTRVNMIVLRLPVGAFTRVAMQFPSILARLTELASSEVVKITT